MKDNSLLEDLKTIKHAEKDVETLRQAGITTYSQLLAVIVDETANEDFRFTLCYDLIWLHRYLDRRKVVTPLLAATNSASLKVRGVAMRTCGSLQLKRALSPISELATDKLQPHLTRMDAMQALGMMGDARALAVLKAIIEDETENIGLRGEAIEQTTSYNTLPVEEYITWLNDSHADLRFWAAYCLGGTRYRSDYSLAPALSALDHVVATDHALPVYWGWHVDREALFPLEIIYYRALHSNSEDVPYYVWVISPASEYHSFVSTHRHWTESWAYTTDEVPETSLRIDPDWLSQQLQQHWADIRLNVREPRPQTYLLDFQLTLGGEMLIGGLHRDGYALVLTGVEEAIFEFAAWYRGLFAAEQPLFLYEWADVATNLTPDITAQEIRQVIEKRDEERRR